MGTRTLLPADNCSLIIQPSKIGSSSVISEYNWYKRTEKEHAIRAENTKGKFSVASNVKV